MKYYEWLIFDLQGYSDYLLSIVPKYIVLVS